MKKPIFLLFLLPWVLTLSACETNQTRVAEGAGIGGLTGAAAGGIIGNQMRGHAGEGVLIGGALGAASGAAIGSQINKPRPAAYSQPAYSSQSTTGLSMREIVELTRERVSSEEIIAKIRATRSHYALTSDDIAYLKREGVSQRVIETMQGY